MSNACSKMKFNEDFNVSQTSSAEEIEKSFDLHMEYTCKKSRCFSNWKDIKELVMSSWRTYDEHTPPNWSTVLHALKTATGGDEDAAAKWAKQAEKAAKQATKLAEEAADMLVDNALADSVRPAAE